MSDNKASVKFRCSGATPRQLAAVTKLVAKFATLGDYLSPQVCAENSVRDRMIVTCDNPGEFIKQIREMGFSAQIYNGPQ